MRYSRKVSIPDNILDIKPVSNIFYMCVRAHVRACVCISIFIFVKKFCLKKFDVIIYVESDQKYVYIDMYRIHIF